MAEKRKVMKISQNLHHNLSEISKQYGCSMVGFITAVTLAFRADKHKFGTVDLDMEEVSRIYPSTRNRWARVIEEVQDIIAIAEDEHNMKPRDLLEHPDFMMELAEETGYLSLKQVKAGINFILNAES